MNSPLVQCPNCKASLLEDVFNQPELTPCPSCGAQVQIEIFPALFRRATAGRDGEALMVEGESTCFYHPNKKAVLPCQGCGRFLCALCDCELHGQHFCPACLEVGKSKGKIKNLENRRTLYDSIALSLAILPMLIFYFTIITAPMALYIAIRYWNAPRSIVHRTKIRYVFAILIAGLQIIGWGLGIYFLTIAVTKHHG
jgi:hypothetical protein